MGANADLFRQKIEEAWNQGRAEALDELLAPDAVIRGLVTGDLVGLPAFKAFYTLFRAAFYDIDLSVERTIEEGDLVSLWCRAAGVHRETGKSVVFSGSICGEFRDGKLQEGWNCWDFLGMLIQLGAVDAEAVGPLLGA
jgi:ketosteroid isomerase-like protein